MSWAGFLPQPLDDDHCIWRGRLPDTYDIRSDAFETLWALHPPSYHRIRMGGRWVDTPRWQQAYGRDYRYTGHVNRAEPVPASLSPLLAYVQADIDPRLNGLLLNWYEAEKGHYIGRHRDKPHDLVVGAPIVTISLGASRTFRLRPHQGAGKIDVALDHGTVVILPFVTNRAWTHEVPLFAKDRGRRISVTIRAFATGPSAPLPAA